MTDARAPGCPIDEAVAWSLERAGPGPAEVVRGEGLFAGLRGLWRHAMREAIDADGRSTGRTAVLHLAPERGLGPRGEVRVALAPAGNTVLLRFRGWLEGPRGVLVLEQLARAHGRLILAGERWQAPAPPPEAESLAPLTLGSVLDDPDALVRALKPGH